jgi:IS1 family transposase
LTKPSPAGVDVTAVQAAERRSARGRGRRITVLLYYRIQHRRSVFDEVVALSFEGVNKSAISRVKRVAWNTVDRWLEKAAMCCRRFNDGTIKDLDVPELQADEIRTFLGDKKNAVWIFATLDVWSRLWPSTVVGRRSYRNTYGVFKDTVNRMKQENSFLIVTDGFDFYEKVARRLFGIACVYGQVIKTRRNDRVIKVERRQVLGVNHRSESSERNGSSRRLSLSPRIQRPSTRRSSKG